MRKMVPYLLALALAVVFMFVQRRGSAQNSSQGSGQIQQTLPVQPLPALYALDDAYLEWPLPQADKAYGSIDGRHLHKYISELATISRDYRDQGHQLWG